MLEVRPSRLFRDSDRDGVADVFDCQPRNRRKQDRRGPIPTTAKGMHARFTDNLSIKEAVYARKKYGVSGYGSSPEEWTPEMKHDVKTHGNQIYDEEEQ